jgi:hypothetical protein
LAQAALREQAKTPPMDVIGLTQIDEPLPALPRHVRDMNLDGKNDIVASSSAFEMWLLLQRSDGTFVSKNEY